MAAAQKMRQLPWDAEALEAMRPVVQASPWAGIDGPADALSNAHLWEYRAGRVHVLLAVRGVQCEGGRVLDIVGARSLGQRFHTEDLRAAMGQLVGEIYPAVDLLSMCTRHAHLVRACEREGWSSAATIMTKRVRLHG